MAELESIATTTGELPTSDRPGFWQEQFRSNHGGAQIRFEDHPTFSGSLRVQRLPGYTLGNWQNMQFASTPISYRRTASDIDSDGDRSTRLVIPRRGNVRLKQGGMSVLLRPGQIGVIDWSRDMELSHQKPVIGWAVTIPSDVLRIAPGAPPHLSLDTSNALFGSVLGLAEQLWRRADAVTSRHFLTICATIATLLSAGLDERWAPESETLAAIGQDARHYIQRNSDDHRMTVESIAAHFGITRRQLERALKLSGTTPYSFLLTTRLERAEKRLRDPILCRRSIADIAYASGFSTLSTFNRAYRDKYGVTPSQIRDRAHR
ncbi:AraC family transcriptional regulator [Nocardia sp. NPDC005746]|uniref:AraC family transcriptional regulator n=1 Tax=Nocardia sp. NPDC005746 TaxID=3157062 RepID=UPI0033C19C7B